MNHATNSLLAMLATLLVIVAPVLVIVAPVLVSVASLGCSGSKQPADRSAQTATDAPVGTVTLEFDFADEVRVVTVEDVRQGTTLEKVMRELDDPRIELTGAGTTAFISRIGDFDTSGREGWTFKVDGEFSPSGVGTTELDPPTTVSWRYGDFSPPSQ